MKQQVSPNVKLKKNSVNSTFFAALSQFCWCRFKYFQILILVYIFQGTISKVYGVSMIISSLFLVLTLIVFGLLWEKHRHNIQRWTIFSYVATLFLMYFFFIFSHFSNYFDGDVVTNETMCRTIGKSHNLTAAVFNLCNRNSLSRKVG